MKNYYIGIDNGGTFIKAGLFSADGILIAMAKEASVAVAAKNGNVELDQDELWKINCTCVSKVISKSKIDPKSIKYIGMAGQGKGLYTVDEKGRSIRKAITSADGRSWEYVTKWKNEGVAQKIFSLTYQGLFASHPVSILAWLKDNEYENYNKIRWVFSMKDFLVYRMTGKAVSDYCNQSGGSFMDLNTEKYAPEILDMLGIPEIKEKLPVILKPHEICGEVTAEAAAQMGCAVGTKVITGMFDVDASAVGMGLVNEDCIGIITGTCGINAYISKNPVKNGSVLMNSYYCIPGYYYVEEGSNTSAGILEWVINILYKEEKAALGKEIYKKLDTLVATSDRENSETIFLPFLYGSALNSKARGGWLGLDAANQKEDLLCAAYEGIVFTHRWHIERLLKNRDRPNQIRISGGAVHSQIWMQIFADVLQVPIEIIDGQEMGLRGLFMAEGVADGIYTDYAEAFEKGGLARWIVMPDAKLKDIYDRKYKQYIQCAEQLGAL